MNGAATFWIIPPNSKAHALRPDGAGSRRFTVRAFCGRRFAKSSPPVPQGYAGPECRICASVAGARPS